MVAHRGVQQGFRSCFSFENVVHSHCRAKDRAERFLDRPYLLRKVGLRVEAWREVDSTPYRLCQL